MRLTRRSSNSTAFEAPVNLSQHGVSAAGQLVIRFWAVTSWLCDELTGTHLNQLLITIRLLTLLHDHSQSETRLIVIMYLIAMLWIIYTTACRLVSDRAAHPVYECTITHVHGHTCHLYRQMLSGMNQHLATVPTQLTVIWYSCEPVTLCWLDDPSDGMIQP